MESYTPMDVFPGDIGLSNDMNETTEYIKYGMENGICKISSKANMLFLTDESGSRLIGVLDGDQKEYYFTYEATTKLEAVISEYKPNLYDQETGAIVIEDSEGNLFNLCAEVDFYCLIEKMELPLEAEMSIYAMAMDINIFSDTAEFNSIVNKNPITTSPEGIPIGFGPVFMTPTGIMPGNEDISFPAMTYVHAIVKKVETKTHSFTKNEFFVLTCKGVTGDFELLCSPMYMNENVKEGSVVVGYVMFRVDILKARKIENETNE
ncbi:MAG: hypothetical protein R3A12_03640 [Ignavibacteria bacterium]